MYLFIFKVLKLPNLAWKINLNEIPAFPEQSGQAAGMSRVIMYQNLSFMFTSVFGYAISIPSFLNSFNIS